jgi:hypothetical protein
MRKINIRSESDIATIMSTYTLRINEAVNLTYLLRVPTQLSLFAVIQKMYLILPLK